MSLTPLSVETSKKAILWLLAGSCLTALLILLLYPAGRHITVHDLVQTDSLIHQELALFNIPQDRIRVTEYPVNDHFSRKRYFVDLPVQVSKTHLHAELNKQLRPRNIKTIGQVDVVNNEMTLNLIYRDKLIRSLELHTDPTFVRVPHPAELMVYFDRNPTASQIERIRQFDIPAGIVLRSDSRRALVRWINTLPDMTSEVWIWYDDARTAYRETPLEDPELIQTLKAVSQARDNIRLLASFSGERESSGRKGTQTMTDLNIKVHSTSGMMINSGEDRFEFDRQMLVYSRLARQAAGPQLLVRVSDATLDWLEEWIPRIKRGGVIFTSS